MGKTSHDRQGFKVRMRKNGVGRKVVGIVCGIAVLVAAILPFWAVGTHPQGPGADLSSNAPEDPLLFFVTLSVPMILLFAVELAYSALLKAFPERTDNIQTKVIFVTVITLLCFFLPLRDFYVTKSMETRSHYRALSLLSIISTWINRILALLLFANSTMNYLVETMGYKFPVLLSPNNANMLLAVETLVGSMMGFTQMIMDTHGLGSGCRFNQIHQVFHRVFRCSGDTSLDQPCPVMELKVVCARRPDEVEEFEGRDNYNWTDWAMAATKGMTNVVNHPNYLNENFWEKGYWDALPDDSNAKQTVLSMTNLQTETQTKTFPPPFITRLFGYENTNRNIEEKYVSVGGGLSCLIQCGAYNSSDPTKPYWGETQITQCEHQGIQGFDWAIMNDPNIMHHLCPGYGPTTKTPDVNNRELDYNYMAVDD